MALTFRRWMRDLLLTVLILMGFVTLAHALFFITAIHICDQTKHEVAGLDVRVIGESIQLFHARVGRCPSGDVLGALVDAQYLERVPLDPWDRPYLIDALEAGLVLGSLGRDGEPGGDGQDADIRHVVPCPPEHAPPPEPARECP